MFRVHQHVDDVNVCSFPPFLWVGCCGARCTHCADAEVEIEMLQSLASIFFTTSSDGGTRASAVRKPTNDRVSVKSREMVIEETFLKE